MQGGTSRECHSGQAMHQRGRQCMDKIVPRYGQVRGQGALHGPPTKHGRRHFTGRTSHPPEEPSAISARARRRPKKNPRCGLGHSVDSGVLCACQSAVTDEAIYSNIYTKLNFRRRTVSIDANSARHHSFCSNIGHRMQALMPIWRTRNGGHECLCGRS